MKEYQVSLTLAKWIQITLSLAECAAHLRTEDCADLAEVTDKLRKEINRQLDEARNE